MKYTIQSFVILPFLLSFLLGCEPQSRDSQIKEESLPSLRMEVLAEIGLEDQPFAYQLGKPKGVLTDSTGNIYIADWASQSIKVFGPDGAYIRTQGGRGRGPGEFQGIHMMARTPDHSLFVMDWGGLEYEYLTMDGRQLSSSQADLSSQLTQYYPNQVAWYDTLTIGIDRNNAPSRFDPPKFKRDLFRIYTHDFQTRVDSFFPFEELGYTQGANFVWSTFGQLPGSFVMLDNTRTLLYAPGVYTGKLYQFTRSASNEWSLVRKIDASEASNPAYEIIPTEEEFERQQDFSGALKVFSEGGPYMGRVYSLDAGIYELNNGDIAHFYGEWSSSNTTLEQGNSLQIYVQIIDREGTVKAISLLTSIQRDYRQSISLVNWKDEQDNFYLIDLPRDEVPTVVKFRLVKGE